MEFLENMINAVTGVLWGPPLLIILIGGGLYLTIRLRFLQIRKFGYIWSQTFGSVFKKRPESLRPDISEFTELKKPEPYR